MYFKILQYFNNNQFQFESDIYQMKSMLSERELISGDLLVKDAVQSLRRSKLDNQASMQNLMNRGSKEHPESDVSYQKRDYERQEINALKQWFDG